MERRNDETKQTIRRGKTRLAEKTFESSRRAEKKSKRFGTTRKTFSTNFVEFFSMQKRSERRPQILQRKSGKVAERSDRIFARSETKIGGRKLFFFDEKF